MKCVDESLSIDEPYRLLHTANLVGLFSCVFVKTSQCHRVHNVSAGEIKRGMGGLHGNKVIILMFAWSEHIGKLTHTGRLDCTIHPG